jgi:hypothetical protein
LEFDQCVETGLHLVNLGAVKRVEEATMTWLASTSSFRPKVGRAANAIMEDISKQNLDWFRLECFQTSEFTHGGWVGVHFSAFARFLPEFAAVVVDQTKAKVSVDSVLGEQVQAFLFLSETLHCLVSRLLTRLCVEKNDLRNYIKTFLSAVQAFDSLTVKEDIVLKTSNFLSLLKLPDQVERFGPFHWYWEGNRERYIQSLKPHLGNLRKTSSFFCRRLLDLFNLDELETGSSILSNTIEEDNDNDVDERSSITRRSGSVKTYASAEEIKERMNNGLALSSVLFVGPNKDDGQLSCILHKNGKRDFSDLKACQILFDDDRGIVDDDNGLWWCPISLVNNNPIGDELSRLAKTAAMREARHQHIHSCLTSHPVEMVDTDYLYRASTEEWTHRRFSNTWVLRTITNNPPSV